MNYFPLVAFPLTLSIIFSCSSEGLATVLKASQRMAGFSTDSRHYIYLESSRNPVTDVPTAQIQIINVANSSCVRNGCLETEYDRSAYNLSNQAAENDLLEKTLMLRQRLELNRLKVGIQLPVISRQRTPNETETVNFRLNKQTEPLQIRLEQRYIPSVLSGGSSPVDRAAMRLIINYNYRQLTLGNLNNYRDAVRNYSIREVRLSPNQRNAVVLIDMTQPSEEGVLQTTLVQSFSLEPFGI
ncbi:MULTISPECIES: DUF2259 domain-containing protein [unclassified Coleofasciculus]|uniref:DUF2259 domain-containing protein n=1 Tax=unclassified Coleofasciculus TaxID=2692782 RepID=UPI00187EB72F|nr:MULTISPECIES: DUF2259 domain-containing protein [unclassified Coleofasciculus]MBE9128961.1 DUF2259 domain-containing protein [Coleofasciculus sp. LEGE 07081]MBE9151701.1 DUF2259 domain-containing protein [Coleofasciculus sp. LEGE 07092]